MNCRVLTAAEVMIDVVCFDSLLDGAFIYSEERRATGKFCTDDRAMHTCVSQPVGRSPMGSRLRTVSFLRSRGNPAHHCDRNGIHRF